MKRGDKPKTSRTSRRHVSAAQKTEKVLALRLKGLSFSKIGKEVGISKQRAHQVVDEWLQESLEELKGKAQELRLIELARLDTLQAGLWARATRGDPRAIDTMLRVMERRARLTGIDAPLKIIPGAPDGKLHDIPDDAELEAIVEAVNARSKGALPGPDS
jgi:hypothetical protein